MAGKDNSTVRAHSGPIARSSTSRKSSSRILSRTFAPSSSNLNQDRSIFSLLWRTVRQRTNRRSQRHSCRTQTTSFSNGGNCLTLSCSNTLTVTSTHTKERSSRAFLLVTPLGGSNKLATQMDHLRFNDLTIATFTPP